MYKRFYLFIIKTYVILLFEIFSIFCQILTIEDDKVFDLKFTRYTKPKPSIQKLPNYQQ